MKICIIHGSPRKGNTYHAAEIFKEELQKHGNFEFAEFFLHKDLPHFCCGCFACIKKSETRCPHAQCTQPIAASIREADGLILTTPVYSLAESGQIKAFLDHFSYQYMNHRPMEEMFSKVATVISTTAGYGTGYAMKTIARALRFWGIKRVQKCGFILWVIKWAEISPEKQQKIRKKIHGKAKAFYHLLVKRKQLQPSLFTRFYFRICKKLMLSFADGQTDKEYWRQKGWLNSKNRPF
ncbi:MAG: flavodoxin family protein [Bacteroidota bacterium]